MESLRKTARVLDVVARIAFWVTMVVGALLLLLWALNLRDPFFTKYMGGLLMAGNLNFPLAEPVNFPWGAMLVLAAMSVTTGSFAKAADARDAAQANHVAAEDVVWEMK